MYAPFASISRQFGLALVIALALTFSWSRLTLADEADGVVRVKSAYAMEETIARVKKDIADQGIMFFQEVNQSQLAEKAGIKLNPSTLLTFGNPPLGTLCLSSNPNSGLDWAVRVLVRQDDNGQVWASVGSRAATTSRIAMRSSRWPRWWSSSITATVKAK